MSRFNFPIVIIDEDFRSENTSGLGIRALADAIEKEGFEVLGTRRRYYRPSGADAYTMRRPVGGVAE